MSSNLSVVQKDKLLHMFELIDVDGNGVLEYADFRLVVDTMADDRGWSPTHRRRLGLVRANQRLWNMMARHLDADGDGEITLAEWLSFHMKAFGDDPELQGKDMELSSALNSTAKFFCDMLDSDGDGKVSEIDYIMFCGAYNIDSDEAKESFRLFDTNKDGILQQNEVFALVKEFYLSDDEDAPGNIFFGML